MGKISVRSGVKNKATEGCTSDTSDTSDGAGEKTLLPEEQCNFSPPRTLDLSHVLRAVRIVGIVRKVRVSYQKAG